MLKVASHYDYNRMAKIATSPKIKIVASLRAPNWKDHSQVKKFNAIKNKVSRARFKWDPSNKQWFKIVPKVHIDEGILNYDFDWQLS